jgi:hypothetical protein
MLARARWVALRWYAHKRRNRFCDVQVHGSLTASHLIRAVVWISISTKSFTLSRKLLGSFMPHFT